MRFIFIFFLFAIQFTSLKGADNVAYISLSDDSGGIYCKGVKYTFTISVLTQNCSSTSCYFPTHTNWQISPSTGFEPSNFANKQTKVNFLTFTKPGRYTISASHHYRDKSIATGATNYWKDSEELIIDVVPFGNFGYTINYPVDCPRGLVNLTANVDPGTQVKWLPIANVTSTPLAEGAAVSLDLSNQLTNSNKTIYLYRTNVNAAMTIPIIQI